VAMPMSTQTILSNPVRRGSGAGTVARSIKSSVAVLMGAESIVVFNRHRLSCGGEHRAARIGSLGKPDSGSSGTGPAESLG
jgi:hypothetical protein